MRCVDRTCPIELTDNLRVKNRLANRIAEDTSTQKRLSYTAFAIAVSRSRVNVYPHNGQTYLSVLVAPYYETYDEMY